MASIPIYCAKRKTQALEGLPKLSLTTQCDLLSLNRTSLYYRPVPPIPEEQALKRRIDELYTAYRFQGSREFHAIILPGSKNTAASLRRPLHGSSKVQSARL
jgi:hypothetical protein